MVSGDTATAVTQKTWSNQEASAVAPEQGTVRVTYTLRWDAAGRRWLIVESEQMGCDSGRAYHESVCYNVFRSKASCMSRLCMSSDPETNLHAESPERGDSGTQSDQGIDSVQGDVAITTGNVHGI